MEEHKGMKDLYDNVTSGKFGLERFDLLRYLMDHTLHHVEGNILEIGLGETTIYTTELSKKYNRLCFHCDYSKSLIENLQNTNGYFGDTSVIYEGKSQDFFREVDVSNLAFAFIDGSHVYKDVKNDFYSALDRLNKNGIIALHDTLPPNETWIPESKCGNVFLLRKELEKDYNLDVFTFPFGVFGVGLTIVRKKSKREWEEKYIK